MAPTGQAMTARRTSWNSASDLRGRPATSVKTYSTIITVSDIPIDFVGGGKKEPNDEMR